MIRRRRIESEGRRERNLVVKLKWRGYLVGRPWRSEGIYGFALFFSRGGQVLFGNFTTENHLLRNKNFGGETRERRVAHKVKMIMVGHFPLNVVVLE